MESSMPHMVLERICSPAKKGSHFHPPYQVEPVRSLRPLGDVLNDNVQQSEVQPLFYEDVYPVVKGSWFNIMLQAPFIISEATGMVFHD